MGSEFKITLVQNNTTYLRHHVFERFHNFGALALLIIGKDTSNNNHSSQYNTQVQLKHQSQRSQSQLMGGKEHLGPVPMSAGRTPIPIHKYCSALLNKTLYQLHPPPTLTSHKFQVDIILLPTAWFCKWPFSSKFP